MLEGSQRCELLAENKWLSLPKALWLEIYQYIFLDLVSDFLNDKTNFNRVCRVFNQFSHDPDFLKILIERYYPILMDSPDFEKNPQKFLRLLREHLGFNLPPIDEPKLFVENYTSAAMRMGFTYDVVRSRLRNELSRIYNKLSSWKSLMVEMEQALEPGETFFPLEEISEVFRLVPKLETQRDFSAWEISAPYFRRSLILATEFYNFRALVALFHPSRLTHQGLSGLQWAAAISDLPMLRELMSRKERYCQLRRDEQAVNQEEDHLQNETLIAVRRHLETNHLEEIRRCLYADISRVGMKNVLNNAKMCERVLTWRFDELFREMTADTFDALKALAGDGDFQDALAVSLARNACFSLLPLVKVSESVGHSIVKPQHFADCFFRAYKLSLEKPNSDCPPFPQATAWAATWQAMLDNLTIRDVLVRDPLILIWAFSVKRIDLILLCLPHGYKLDYENEAHRQCVRGLLEWACENNHQNILELIMNELYGNFITLITNVATRQYQVPFMAVVKSMRVEQKIKYVREMLILAANRGDVSAIDDLLAHYVTEEIIATLAFELHSMCGENEKLRRVLLKVVAVVDFNNYPFYEAPLFLDIAHWADPRYLENFLVKHIDALPDSAWINFVGIIIRKIDGALTTKMMACTLHAVRYSPILSKNVLMLLLRILAGDLISQQKINENPEMLLEFSRHYHQDNHDEIIDIFWPILTLQAKVKFLDALPKDSGFHKFDGALMRHIPEVRGWDRARIRAYILDPTPVFYHAQLTLFGALLLICQV